VVESLEPVGLVGPDERLEQPSPLRAGDIDRREVDAPAMPNARTDPEQVGGDRPTLLPGQEER
jgi:hypothetical protein